MRRFLVELTWFLFPVFGSTDRLITTGNRQQTTTDPVHSHGEINRSRHRHRLKKGLRWLTFSTDVSKLLIIGCFVCSHDRHHLLTLCQIYSITDKVQHSLQTRNLNLTATNEIRFADRWWYKLQKNIFLCQKTRWRISKRIQTMHLVPIALRFNSGSNSHTKNSINSIVFPLYSINRWRHKMTSSLKNDH